MGIEEKFIYMEAIIKQTNKHNNLLFYIFGFVTFLSGFNSTSIATVMPHIDFVYNSSLYSYVFNSFLFMSMLSLFLCGRLIDLYGVRIVLLTGLVIFTVASYLCSTSIDIYELIFYRGFQGFGAGALTISAISYIALAYPKHIRAKKQSTLAAIYGVSSVIGPILGIYILDNSSWKNIFLLNIPLSLICFIAVYILTKKEQVPKKKIFFDYLGFLYFFILFTLILSVVILFKEYIYLTIILIIMMYFLFKQFIVHENKVLNPFMSMHFFKNSIFLLSIFFSLLCGGLSYLLLVFLPIYFIDTNYILVFLILGLVIGNVSDSLLLPKVSNSKILILVSLCLMIISFIFIFHTKNIFYFSESFFVFLLGIGIGKLLIISLVSVQNTLPLDKVGEVSSQITIFRSMGGVLALSVSAGVIGPTLTNSIVLSLFDIVIFALVLITVVIVILKDKIFVIGKYE